MSTSRNQTIQAVLAEKALFTGHVETGDSKVVGNGLQWSLFYKKKNEYPHIHATEVMEVWNGLRGKKKKKIYMIEEFHYSEGGQNPNTFWWKDKGGTFKPKNGGNPTDDQKKLAKDFVALFNGTVA